MFSEEEAAMARAFARPIGVGDRVFYDGARGEGTIQAIVTDDAGVNLAVIRTRYSTVTRPLETGLSLVYARNH